MQNFLEKAASNLVVAAFIPASVFVVILSILSASTFSNSPLSYLNNVFDKPIYLLLFLSGVISIFLLYLRELIYALYRGLYLPRFLNFIELIKARRLLKKIKHENESISSSPENVGILVASYKARFPYTPDPYRLIGREQLAINESFKKEFLPTELGNIFRAAELYPLDRYMIRSEHVWNRLSLLIPDDIYQRIDSTNNQLFFLINLSFLSGISGLYCAIRVLFDPQLSDLSRSQFLSDTVIFLLLFYLFYRISIPLAKVYTSMYCGAFDLFRNKLLESMNITRPASSSLEMIEWEKICELLSCGRYKGELNFGQEDIEI